jgi:hypothetical protein
MNWLQWRRQPLGETARLRTTRSTLPKSLTPLALKILRSSRSRPLLGMLSSPMASLVPERLLLVTDSPQCDSNSGRTNLRYGSNTW